MSQFDDVLASCKKQMEECGIDCDEQLLTAVAKGLGPSIYNKDSSVVASGDEAEVNTVKQNFIAGKLGVEGEQADAAIAHAVEKLGSGNRQKLRPVFYYLVVKFLGKESVYA